MAFEKTIIIDTETTGLLTYCGNTSEEILQLAIINGDGVLLFSDLFKPRHKTRWDKAQRINGISPEMVRDKACFHESREQVQNIIDASDLIVAYNVNFDCTFLKNAGILFRGKKYYDVMKEFAMRHGAVDRIGRRLYVSLERCAAYYGYRHTGAHDALNDARVTLFCFKELMAEL